MPSSTSSSNRDPVILRRIPEVRWPAAALVASALAPVWIWIVDGPRAVLCLVLLAIWIWIRHHANIRRLVAGTETRIGQKG